MMIEELTGFVGLSGEFGIEAESGLYVDALPDISTTIIDRLAPNGCVCDEWLRIEKRTLLKLRTLFIQEVNKCHKVHDVNICECLILSNKMLLATTLWYLLGAEVMLERNASSRINAATLDRSKQKELREYFEKKAEDELHIAVNSINIHDSECFPPDVEPEERPMIHTAYPCL